MTVCRIGAPMVACLTLLVGAPAQAQQANMTFFVTSVGPGKGADLGGLAGADRHCQQLASAAGAGSKTWHAYLSTQGAGAENARDRIGKGPWVNAKGARIAKDVADLHSSNNNLTKQTALTEKGEVNNGRGDTPNKHDVLTGSQPDGPLPAARIAPARIGRAAPKAQPCSGMLIGSGCATTMLPNPGTRRIHRVGRTAAARRPIFAAPAATDCSIVSRPTRQAYKIPKLMPANAWKFYALPAFIAFSGESVVLSRVGDRDS